MVQVLSTIFWLSLSFMTLDYVLGRARLTDPARAIVAAVFAVLFVIFVRTTF